MQINQYYDSSGIVELTIVAFTTYLQHLVSDEHIDTKRRARTDWWYAIL